MSKTLTIAGLLIGGFLLQVGIAPYISIAGISPNFLIIVVVVAAMINGSDQGAGVGFVGGLMFDLLGAGAVGPAALVFTITGYLVGLLAQHLFAEGWLLPVTVLGIASLFSEFLYLVFSSLLGSSVPFFTALYAFVLPTAVYTSIISVLLFSIISRVLQQDERVEILRRIG